MNYVRIDKKDQLAPRMENLTNRLSAFWNFQDHALLIEYKIFEDPRTTSQNKLYWMWLNEMAKNGSPSGVSQMLSGHPLPRPMPWTAAI